MRPGQTPTRCRRRHRHDEPDVVGAAFLVRGKVDGRPAEARWCDGTLTADDLVRRHVDIVVDLGERFVDADDPSRVVVASIDGRREAALLAVLRAFSEITFVEVTFGPVTAIVDE
jgi:hypothetical protein